MAYYHFVPQADFVLSRRSVVKVTRLVPFENVDPDLVALLGLERGLPRENVTLPSEEQGGAGLSLRAAELVRRLYPLDQRLYAFAVANRGHDVRGRSLG